MTYYTESELNTRKQKRPYVIFEMIKREVSSGAETPHRYKVPLTNSKQTVDALSQIQQRGHVMVGHGNLEQMQRTPHLNGLKTYILQQCKQGQVFAAHEHAEHANPVEKRVGEIKANEQATRAEKPGTGSKQRVSAPKISDDKG